MREQGRGGAGAWILAAVLAGAGCAAPEEPAEEPPPAAEAAAPVEWALAIHGGAGVIPKTMEEASRREYVVALEEALALGRDLLAAGEPALDVVERVVRHLEDVPLFNAGKGAVFTHEGRNELDAAIMDGRDRACGAVAGLTTVKNPISLARLVMERSPHVFFIGAGAEAFADEMGTGVERVDPSYYFTQRRHDQWREELEKAAAARGAAPPEDRDTVGAVARDRRGDLAAATSTGGLTGKRFGRVGDVPVIGAGTWADNRTVAVSCTGDGEEFIRHAVAHSIHARVEHLGETPQAAAEAVVHGVLQPGDGGVIVVGRNGEIALVWSSEGMFRGAADSAGRFEVGIWEDWEG